MPHVRKVLQVPFNTQQMYELVNDVEAYPEFLPWCKSTTVHLRAQTQLHATLCIGKGLVKQSISTKNTMIPNQKIAMEYQAGPFKFCKGSWEFIAQQDTQQCQVVFDMQYEFKNSLTALTMEPLFNPIADTLVEAFSSRARQIYAT